MKTEEATMVMLSTRVEMFTKNHCLTDQYWVLPRMVAQFTLQFTAEAHHTMTVKLTSAMVLFLVVHTPTFRPLTILTSWDATVPELLT
jgi:hypothetical protein